MISIILDRQYTSMKIALHNPFFIFPDQSKNFNGYNFEFLKTHTDIIYLSKPWDYPKYIKRLKQLNVDKKKYEFIFSLNTLNHKADVLLSFNGEPYLNHFSPPKGFTGMKIWHTMDYVFKATASNNALMDAGVDYLMGYTKHDWYCPFFRFFFASFIGKVIPVPFGYGERFQYINTKDRINKCIALGSVNPVNDPLCKKETLTEYIAFYKNEYWTHKFRRTIAENISNLQDIVDSRLPINGKTKNANYDPVLELNQYKLFVNDEGLMNFPPARTYEGIACGCIMVASNNKIYEDLGFMNGVNYIGFSKNDLGDFRTKTTQALMDNFDLSKIKYNSLRLSERYTHQNVAKNLKDTIMNLFKS